MHFINFSYFIFFYSFSGFRVFDDNWLFTFPKMISNSLSMAMEYLSHYIWIVIFELVWKFLIFMKLLRAVPSGQNLDLSSTYASSEVKVLLYTILESRETWKVFWLQVPILPKTNLIWTRLWGERFDLVRIRVLVSLLSSA